MIPREKRIKIWHLIKRIALKLGVTDIPQTTASEYWEYMKLPNENVRYLLIEHYNLGEGFFYHAYEESDLEGKNTQDEKMKEMFEEYFSDAEGDSTGEILLLIDIKNIKAYTLSKEVRYTKKEVK